MEVGRVTLVNRSVPGQVRRIACSSSLARGHHIIALAALLLSLALAGCLGAAPFAPSSALVTLEPPRLSCPTPCALEVESGPDFAFEPAVAVDPLDPLHILAASMQIPDLEDPDRAVLNPIWSDLHVSFDGGLRWETQRAPGGPDADPTHENALDNKMGDAVVAFLPDGTPLFSYLANTRLGPPTPLRVQDGNSVYLARSPDGGRTWPEIVRVAEGGGAFPGPLALPGSTYHDKQWLDVGPDGALLMAWVAFRNGEGAATVSEAPVMFSASRDGGRTWSPARPVDDRPESDFQGASPLVGEDGTWHVAYFDYDTHALRLATSRDQGASWDVREIGLATFIPFLKAGPGPRGERLWLSFPMPAGEEEEQPALVWSDDGGATWTQPLVLDEPQPVQASIPALDVAPDGMAYVGWFRNECGDGCSASLIVQAFRGDVAGPPLMVHGDIPGSGADVGHYFGLAALPDGAIAAYTAQGESSRNVFAARLALEGAP